VALTARAGREPLRVVCIMGRGRGGSTILASVLGAYGGFLSVGEVRVLWDPVVPYDTACACRRPVSSCELWGPVLAGLGDVDVAQAGAWQRAVVSERKLPRLLRRGAAESWPELRSYAEVMGRVYRALAEHSGARVIIDSSKRPAYAASLFHVPGIEVRAVHLVRDPRASAYSWKTRRYASFGPGAEVRRRGALDATLRWDVLNAGAAAVLRRAGDQGRRVRFEDFTASPRRLADELVTFAGGRAEPSPFIDERTVELPIGHAVAGNPSRYATGRIEITPQTEWLRHQGRLDRLVATAVSLPYLLAYGYPLRAR
jgi:hypothetical protein